MNFSVKVFLGDEPIAPEDLSKLSIHNVTVDRIVNEIYETSAEEVDTPVA